MTEDGRWRRRERERGGLERRSSPVSCLLSVKGHCVNVEKMEENKEERERQRAQQRVAGNGQHCQSPVSSAASHRHSCLARGLPERRKAVFGATDGGCT